MNPRIVEVRQNILRKNDLLARALRERWTEAGVFVVSLVSSPGAGKTALLERTLSVLHPVRRVAVVVGDLATDRDAAVRNVQQVRADLPILEASSRTGAGLDDWHAWLETNAQRHQGKNGATVAVAQRF